MFSEKIFALWSFAFIVGFSIFSCSAVAVSNDTLTVPLKFYDSSPKPIGITFSDSLIQNVLFILPFSLESRTVDGVETQYSDSVVVSFKAGKLASVRHTKTTSGNSATWKSIDIFDTKTPELKALNDYYQYHGHNPYNGDSLHLIFQKSTPMIEAAKGENIQRFNSQTQQWSTEKETEIGELSFFYDSLKTLRNVVVNVSYPLAYGNGTLQNGKSQLMSMMLDEALQIRYLVVYDQWEVVVDFTTNDENTFFGIKEFYFQNGKLMLETD